MSNPVLIRMADHRRRARNSERARCLRDVRDELRGVTTLLTACISTLENHARMPEVERELDAASAHLEGLVARIEREL
jgi:hypothetical protein